MKCLEFYVLIMADSANGQQTEQKTNKTCENIRAVIGVRSCLLSSQLLVFFVLRSVLLRRDNNCLIAENVPYKSCSIYGVHRLS